MKAKPFKHQDIIDYYSQTEAHYRRWWQLDKALAVHYGIWDNKTKNLRQALHNTNFHMASLVGITKHDHVLDAGCGVGGSSFFLVNGFGCKVTGITLSEKQLRQAKKIKDKFKDHRIDFILGDYSDSNLSDASFDVIWACESTCHAMPKSAFIREASRLLPVKGRLVVADYFLTESGVADRENLIQKWKNCWAIHEFNTVDNFINILPEYQFKIIREKDFTTQIMPTAKRMYKYALLGSFPSYVYNLLFNPTYYAKMHYKSGIYQYQALKKGLWRYKILVVEKL